MSKNNSIISFGKYDEVKGYNVLNERAFRASAGIMFLFGLVAFINGFIFKNFEVLPHITGILLINFFIGIFINPKFAPTMILGEWIVSKQDPIFIGAIQKKFAWALGLVFVFTVFTLSLFLISDHSLFPIVCLLCITCLILLYLETAFGICIGCNLYFLAIKLKLLKEPKVRPACTGNSCKIG